MGQKVDKRMDKRGEFDHDQGSVGTNYVKARPDIPSRNASNLRSKFENMAQQSVDEAQDKAADEKKRREEREKREREQAKKLEEKRKISEDLESKKREELQEQEEARMMSEMDRRRKLEDESFKKAVHPADHQPSEAVVEVEKVDARRMP